MADLFHVKLKTSAPSNVYPFKVVANLIDGEATNVNLTGSGIVSCTRAILATSDGTYARQAVFTGYASYTSGAWKDFTVTDGAGSAGTPMTYADIDLGGLTTSVRVYGIDFGAFDTTVSLAPLLASAPRYVHIATEDYIECVYTAAIGSDLWAEFIVKYFKNGEHSVVVKTVRGEVTQGLGGWMSYSYNCVVTIGGTEVWNAPLQHWGSTAARWEHYVGVDPDFEVDHDLVHLTATKRVPQYHEQYYTAGLAELPGFVDQAPQTYSPFDFTPGQSTFSYEMAMGAGGTHVQLGPLPRWEVFYLLTGHEKLRRGVIVNSLRCNILPFNRARHPTTRLPIDVADWPGYSITADGLGGPGWNGHPDVAWAMTHMPSIGYLAYLLTGDYEHLEMMALHCGMNYLAVSVADGGTGTNRILNAQTRGWAWACRNLGQFCGIAPDNFPPLASMKLLLGRQYERLHAHGVGATNPTSSDGTEPDGCNQLGFPSLWSTYHAGFPISMTPLMHAYFCVANNHVAELGPRLSPTDTAHMEWATDFMLKMPIGMFGTGTGVNTGYHLFYSGAYVLQLGDVIKGDAQWTMGSELYDTWDVVASVNGLSPEGRPNSLGFTLDGVNWFVGASPTDYSGLHFCALNGAIDRGIEDAPAALARVQSTTNYSQLFNPQAPEFGVAPRGFVAPPPPPPPPEEGGGATSSALSMSGRPVFVFNVDGG
jgi:hypothetical protein